MGHMRTPGQRWYPALKTVGILAGALTAYQALNWATTDGADDKNGVVSTAQFGLWLAIASFAIVVFASYAVTGYVDLFRSQRYGERTSVLVRYILLMAAFGGGIVAALSVSGTKSNLNTVDIGYWDVIRIGLVVAGVVAGGPWVIGIWRMHAALGTYRGRISELPTAAEADAAQHPPAPEPVRRWCGLRPAKPTAEPSGNPVPAARLDHMMHRLLTLRNGISVAVVHLLTLVLFAVVMAGALRGAVVFQPPPVKEGDPVPAPPPGFVSADDFSESSIVIYGAFFTAMLAIAALPLLLAWKRTATQLLDQAYPRHVVSTQDDADARSRLSTTLDINGTLFTSPVALSAVLSPLIISALAVFVPQVSK